MLSYQDTLNSINYQKLKESSGLIKNALYGTSGLVRFIRGLSNGIQTGKINPGLLIKSFIKHPLSSISPIQNLGTYLNFTMKTRRPGSLLRSKIADLKSFIENPSVGKSLYLKPRGRVQQALNELAGSLSLTKNNKTTSNVTYKDIYTLFKK